jgi:hypothetical protein
MVGFAALTPPYALPCRQMRVIEIWYIVTNWGKRNTQGDY